MITDKTTAAIYEAAYESAQEYAPKYDCMSPDVYFEEGFRQGAIWATEKMAKAVLKVINK